MRQLARLARARVDRSVAQDLEHGDLPAIPVVGDVVPLHRGGDDITYHWDENSRNMCRRGYGRTGRRYRSRRRLVVLARRLGTGRSRAGRVGRQTLSGCR